MRPRLSSSPLAATTWRTPWAAASSPAPRPPSIRTRTTSSSRSDIVRPNPAHTLFLLIYGKLLVVWYFYVGGTSTTVIIRALDSDQDPYGSAFLFTPGYGSRRETIDKCKKIVNNCNLLLFQTVKNGRKNPIVSTNWGQLQQTLDKVIFCKV